MVIWTGSNEPPKYLLFNIVYAFSRNAVASLISINITSFEKILSKESIFLCRSIPYTCVFIKITTQYKSRDIKTDFLLKMIKNAEKGI